MRVCSPNNRSFNREQVARLDTEIKQLENNVRNAEERKTYLEGQLATVSPDASYTGSGGEKVMMSPADRLKALEVSLADLRSKFSPDHPDVRKTLREIAELKKLAGATGGSAVVRRKRLAQLKNELAEKQGKYSDQHPEVKKLKNEIAQLEQTPQAGSGSSGCHRARRTRRISALPPKPRPPTLISAPSAASKPHCKVNSRCIGSVSRKLPRWSRSTWPLCGIIKMPMSNTRRS